jgi:ribonuclease HI
MAQKKSKAVDYPEEDALNIYTDGSMLPGPRRGGTGVIFILINDDGDEEEDAPYLPGYTGATNNQMEIRAPLEALKLALGRHPPFDPGRYRKIIVFTDSQYVYNYYGTAMYTWSANGWKKKDGSPVDNAVDWKELVALIRKAARAGKRFDMRWVPGKKTVRGKAVDKHAKHSAATAPTRLLRPATVRRKRSKQELDRGSVAMEGQRLTIRITKSEFQPLHKLTKYWYEVRSKKSPFYDCRDVIYADPSLPLKAGHTYHVRVNEETSNPRVAKLFREVEDPSS